MEREIKHIFSPKIERALYGKIGKEITHYAKGTIPRKEINMVQRTFSKLRKIIAIIVLSFLIFLAILCGYLVGAMLEVAKAAPKMNPDLLLSNLKENSQIVDMNGNLIEQIDTAEYRKIVPYEQIPKNLINAFISAEDKRFAQHDGVDFYGIAATIRDFFRSGDMRGASTITMQLARNVFLSNDVNWQRKIQEIFLAFQIDDQLDKKQIMESYLNRIFFGQNAYGVEAASQIYFSKHVQDLTIAQCATLASIVPAPSRYALYSTYRPSEVTNERVLDETEINGERYLAIYNPPAYERAKWVLKEMKNNGFISEAEYTEAVNTDVSQTIDAPQKRAQNLSTYITDLVKEQAIWTLMDTQNISRQEARQLLMYGGLTITCTVDMDLQRKLQDYTASLATSLTSPTGDVSPLKLDLRYDDYGNIIGRNDALLYYRQSNLLDEKGRVVVPENQFTIDDKGNLTIQPGRLRGYSGYIDIMDYYTVDDNDVLRSHRVGTIPIDEKYLQVDSNGTMHIAKAFLDTNTTPLYTIREDGAMLLNRDYYDYDDIGVKQPQVSFTVLDTVTGEVRAIIGGREQDDRHFLNRASSYPRQPGSSIKPIADYTGAIAAGNNQGVAMDDAPVQMLENSTWPTNVDLRYRGMMSMQEALVRSSNPVAVRWLQKIGIDTAKEYLSRYGIINREHPDRDHFVEASEDSQYNDENLAMGIGSMTEGLTSLDMAGAYQAIGNNGTRIPAMSISKITNNRGKVYYENKHTGIEVLPPQLNYQLADALRHVIQDGFTNDTVSGGDMALVGKTGTTDDNMDFWFAGTTPYYTTAVWVGADNALISLVGDSRTPANIYANIHAIIHEGREAKKFPIPEGVYEEEVSNITGQTPTSATAAGNGVLVVPVSKETAPRMEDTAYVFRELDARNDLLASDKTPARLRVSKVFLVRPSDYDPSKFNGVVPEDWSRQVPTKVSELGATIPSVTFTKDGLTTIREYNQDDGSYVEKTKLPDGSMQIVSFDRKGKQLEKTIVPPNQQSSESSAEPNRNAPAATPRTNH